MESYSLLLLLALAGLVLAVGTALLGRKEARTVALATTVVALVALVVHLASGHRPGTVESLSPGAFAGEHPTLFVVLVGATVLWWWQTKRSRQR